MQPHWGSDGKTLYYVAPGSKVMAVPIETGASLTVGVPQALFAAHFQPGPRRNGFLVSPDGQRFLLLSTLESTRATPISVVLNWTSGLRR